MSMARQGRLEIHIAKDFSVTPGPRRREEGEFSGQEFLEDVLLPRFREALAAGQKLIVDLDGAAGFATSFLEEAFGGLARLHQPSEVLELIEIQCRDEPFLIEEIQGYIREARQ